MLGIGYCILGACRRLLAEECPFARSCRVGVRVVLGTEHLESYQVVLMQLAVTSPPWLERVAGVVQMNEFLRR